MQQTLAGPAALAQLGMGIERHRPGNTGEPGADRFVPATGGRAIVATPTADIQAVFGPGQRDIEQAAALTLASRLGDGACAARHRIVIGDPRQPTDQLAAMLILAQPEQPDRIVGHVNRVGQKDNGRLQALGTMHRHDAHQAGAAWLSLALDLDVVALEPMQKALQRGHVLAFISECQVHELVDGIGSVGPEAAEQSAPALQPAQQISIELVGRHEICPSQRLAEEAVGFGKLAAPLQRGPESSAIAPGGEAEQCLLIQPQQRTF